MKRTLGGCSAVLLGARGRDMVVRSKIELEGCCGRVFKARASDVLGVWARRTFSLFHIQHRLHDADVGGSLIIARANCPDRISDTAFRYPTFRFLRAFMVGSVAGSDHPLHEPDHVPGASSAISTASGIGTGHASTSQISATPRSRRAGPAFPEEWTLFGEMMLNSTPSKPNAPSTQLSPPATPRPGRSQIRARQVEEPSPFGIIGSPELLPSHGTEPVRTFDYDSDSEDDISLIAPLQPTQTRLSWLPTFSPLWRNITKCVIAYFLASLFTYAPILSGFLSDITSDGDTPSPAGHMVATVSVPLIPQRIHPHAHIGTTRAVYYNPAVSAILGYAVGSG
jgi:hypothetical protein